MGRTIARGVLIFILVASVPILLAVPVATCKPVGGELPGINCMGLTVVALIGTLIYALIVSLALAGRRRAGTGEASGLAILALLVGCLVALVLAAGHR